MEMRTVVMSQRDQPGEREGGGLAPMRTGFAPVVRRHVRAEDGEGAPDQAHGTVGVSAGTPTIHLAESPLQPRHETPVCLSAGEKSKVVGDGRKPEDTWPALTGALTGEVAGD